MKKNLKLILWISLPLLVSILMLFLQVEKKLVKANFSKQLQNWYKYNGITYQKLEKSPQETASLKINETQFTEAQSLKINTITIPAYFYGLDLEIKRQENIDLISYGEIQSYKEIKNNYTYLDLDIHLTDRKDSTTRSIELNQITTVPGIIRKSSDKQFNIDEFLITTVQTSKKDHNSIPVIFHRDIISTTTQSDLIKTKCKLITKDNQIISTYCIFKDYAPKLHQRALLTSSQCIEKEEKGQSNNFCDVEKFLYHVYCKSINLEHTDKKELKEMFVDTICETNYPTI